jgi:GTP cyclohydrolase IA
MATQRAAAQVLERALTPTTGDALEWLQVLGCASVETASRVARFYREFLNPAPFTWTTFPADKTETSLVVQTGIPWFSLCEHHVLPFFGTAAVAYVPAGCIVGLSKLARCVEWHAHGFQVQERLTAAIVDDVMAQLHPKGAAVYLKARHLCMEMRGVCTRGTWTRTTAVRGVLAVDRRLRAEFRAQIR